MKRKTKIVFLSIVAVIVVITGGVAGGKYYMDKKEEQQHAEMVTFVKKHYKVIEDDLRESDRNELITKISINYSTVEHNPMGGIDVRGYVNNDKSLEFDTIIDKENVAGKSKIEVTNMTVSSKLDKLLGDW